ncbi:hint domain-containing protein [Candidatus Korarchaeum cryptofilum]|nr:hint domain-containing protein [Candidatus Korarchaeum cryptofilum]
MREIVGHVISRSTPKKILFVVLKNAKVSLGDFYVIDHPWEGVPVFIRVRDIQTINEEVDLGKAGLLASSSGLISDYSSDLEYMIAECEVLGYRSESGIRGLEAPPSTLSPVMRPDPRELSSFLTPRFSQGLPLTIGRIKGTRVPFSIDIAAIARGHMFVTGMTRSGKSVTGDTIIIIYDSLRRRYFIGPVERFFDSLLPREAPDEVLLDLRELGYETLSLWPDFIPRWSKVAGIYRHKLDKDIYEIETSTGRKVRVTEDHSLLVSDGTNLLKVTPKKLAGMSESYLIVPRGASLRPAGYQAHLDRLLGISLASGVALKDGVLIMDPDIAEVKLACLEAGVDFITLKNRGIFVRSPELAKIVSSGLSSLLNLPEEVEELGVRFYPLARALRELLLRTAIHEKGNLSLLMLEEQRALILSTILSILGVSTVKFCPKGFLVDSISFRMLMDRLENWKKLGMDGGTLLKEVRKVEGLIYRASVNLERVVSVRKVYTNAKYVYDLDVPDTQSFLANGAFVHNSSFVSSLIAKSSDLKPRPRFLILDRRGEYERLSSKGGAIYDYSAFLPRSMSPGALAKRLGYKPGTLSHQLLLLALRDADGDASEALRKLRQVAREMRVRPSLVGEIESRLKREIPKLGNGKELSIVDEVRKNPIVIVDLSSDRRYEDQFLAIRNIVEELSNYAVSRRREGDFALIVVVEEAQYVIPERGFSIVGDPYDSGVAQSLIEAISQAGGYNLGFVIVTQRPAYVSKSVISQANTVVAFRLRNGNDQEAISKYTEVEEVSSYLPTLSDHEALIWGMGSCVPFPVQVEVEVVALPSKSSSSPERAWEKML